MPLQTANENQETSQRQYNAVLKAYRGQQQQCSEDQRIVSYLPMVHKIVGQILGYVRPSLSVEDLVSAGTIGLVKASRDFDASRDAEFKTYAYIRIRGAVIDELRRWSFTPPDVGRQMNQVEQICREHIQKTGNAPSDEFIAESMGITVDKLYRVFENSRTAHFLSINSLTENAPSLAGFLAASDESPSDSLERRELLEQLTAAIQALPTKQRQIVILYYTQQLTMKQIAQAMELTESRVSQLHAGALAKLSAQLGAYHDR